MVRAGEVPDEESQGLGDVVGGEKPLGREDVGVRL